jgi:hypothetical protein
LVLEVINKDVPSPPAKITAHSLFLQTFIIDAV